MLADAFRSERARRGRSRPDRGQVGRQPVLRVRDPPRACASGQFIARRADGAWSTRGDRRDPDPLVGHGPGPRARRGPRGGRPRPPRRRGVLGLRVRPGARRRRARARPHPGAQAPRRGSRRDPARALGRASATSSTITRCRRRCTRGSPSRCGSEYHAALATALEARERRRREGPEGAPWRGGRGPL